jgi:ATP-dependent Lon protease
LKQKSVKASPDNLADYLGVPKYRYGEVEDKDQIGIVTGLAWTEVGGELLTIEAAMMPGKGRMIVTGNLRDVMKESISAAASYVRSRALTFGIEPPLFEKRDIHVHVPDGATPKDGPSAGIAMVTAIVSVMTGIPVHRDVAMTGEITLRGRVLPISGLKEKLLAALRGGIKTVLIPEENAKDLVEIADNIKSGLEIIPITRMDEVLTQALLRKPEPTEWDEMKVVCAAASETPPVEEENIGAPSLTLPGSTKPDRKLAFTLCPLSRSGEDQSRSHGPPRRGVLTSFRNPILKGVGFWGRPPAPRR